MSWKNYKNATKVSILSLLIKIKNPTEITRVVVIFVTVNVCTEFREHSFGHLKAFATLITAGEVGLDF